MRLFPRGVVGGLSWGYPDGKCLVWLCCGCNFALGNGKDPLRAKDVRGSNISINPLKIEKK